MKCRECRKIERHIHAYLALRGGHAGAAEPPFNIGTVKLPFDIGAFESHLRSCRRLSRGEAVKDEGIFSQESLARNSRLIGWVLIALGGVGVLNRLSYVGPFMRSSWATGTILPIAMIILGIWLLNQERSRRKNPD